MVKMHLKYKLLSWLSVIFGSLSLLLFFHFVLFGPLNLIELDFNQSKTIIFNLLLSLIYFTQHSLMIRKSVRNTIDQYLPKETFYSFHSITSGLFLGLTFLFWQQTDLVIFSVSYPYRYLLFFLTAIAIAGLIWAVISLSNFDLFGRKQISNYLKNREAKSQKFVLRGPYKITRHPFYFSILAMIWLYPVMSTDRLLFALIWSCWIVLGTKLEEKDLVEEIGEDYVKYQSTVPMLIPYKFINNNRG
jgi:protein-S-isoprenylcysteine O-methyltransferase Ste14